ncbi:hypothetical protein AVEN_856-1 [Araneus ventricosus]|uniref:Uncharacterized protein n=1 Tax=Araneus ventricosus TaxID=182803 RepID=A0A4Y2NV12_ARAVE|nr:hypothetical protein AVEN_856-1 [Araneus ventricosus]
MVVWLLGPIAEDGSYPSNGGGVVARAARNGSAGATMPDLLSWRLVFQLYCRGLDRMFWIEFSIIPSQLKIERTFKLGELSPYNNNNFCIQTFSIAAIA